MQVCAIASNEDKPTATASLITQILITQIWCRIAICSQKPFVSLLKKYLNLKQHPRLRTI